MLNALRQTYKKDCNKNINHKLNLPTTTWFELYC